MSFLESQKTQSLIGIGNLVQNQKISSSLNELKNLTEVVAHNTHVGNQIAAEIMVLQGESLEIEQKQLDVGRDQLDVVRAQLEVARGIAKTGIDQLREQKNSLIAKKQIINKMKKQQSQSDRYSTRKLETELYKTERELKRKERKLTLAQKRL